MKIISIIQLILFISIALLATIGCVGSIIQCGHYEHWQLGYAVLTILSWWLVKLGYDEVKKQ